MYGNIDAPLSWMRTFSKYLTDPEGPVRMTQCKTDPCIFYKWKDDKLVLILVLYVDDALCAGPRKWVEWAYTMIELKYKIDRLGKLKKHLGTWWEWKIDSEGNIYLVASMPKMIKEIDEKFQEATGRRAKNAELSKVITV